jgi:hypothetical protein
MLSLREVYEKFRKIKKKVFLQPINQRLRESLKLCLKKPYEAIVKSSASKTVDFLFCVQIITGNVLMI